jgi:hypothetical protein
MHVAPVAYVKLENGEVISVTAARERYEGRRNIWIGTIAQCSDIHIDEYNRHLGHGPYGPLWTKYMKLYIYKYCYT